MTTKWHHHNFVPSHHQWNYLIGTGVENIITVAPPPPPTPLTNTASYLDTNTIISHNTTGQYCMCEQGILCNMKNMVTPSSLSSTITSTIQKPMIQSNGIGCGGNVGTFNSSSIANSMTQMATTTTAIVVDGDIDATTASGTYDQYKTFSKQGWWCFVVTLSP